MNKRVASLKKYYENLEYTYKDDDNIMESQGQIYNLISKFPFTETDNFAYRFLKTASVMEENLNIFMSLCVHVDTVPSILNYLYHFGALFKLFPDERHTLNMIGSILVTIYYIHQEYDIQEFLENIIVEDELEWYFEFKDNIVTNLEVEIIILEDSDLHAVINYLKFNSGACLTKIWLQKSIKDTFMWHFEKNVGYLDVCIKIFQSKQELLTSSTSENTLDESITMNVVSIWSEDVIAAKNLARSLNQYIVFINMHMDICPEIVIPFRQIFQPPIAYFNLTRMDVHIAINNNNNIAINNNECTNSSIDPTAHEGLRYDLFYDGTWQKPKQDTYWIHKNILFANATSLDVIECFKSATRGFKNLSTMSNDSRAQMLSKFASILECDGKFLLSEIVSKWINMSYIYGKDFLTIKTERFEMISINKPRTTVILKEEDEISLFQELTQHLIIGNSVIVICNPDLCILAPYCNMFKMCGIPPGVINLMSIEYTNNIACDNIDENNEQNLMGELTQKQYILVSHK